MGFRFQKRIRLFPGVRINLSKSGASTSIGGRGAWFTVGPRGSRTTVGLPGSGLSYTSFSPSRTGHARAPYAAPVPAPAETDYRGSAARGFLWIAVLLLALALLARWV